MSGIACRLGTPLFGGHNSILVTSVEPYSENESSCESFSATVEVNEPAGPNRPLVYAP
jgi:hypothetical protein